MAGIVERGQQPCLLVAEGEGQTRRRQTWFWSCKHRTPRGRPGDLGGPIHIHAPMTSAPEGVTSVTAHAHSGPHSTLSPARGRPVGGRREHSGAESLIQGHAGPAEARAPVPRHVPCTADGSWAAVGRAQTPAPVSHVDWTETQSGCLTCPASGLLSCKSML